MPVKETRLRIAELAESGQLREVRVEGWREPEFLHADANLPSRMEAEALLSPFDPVVWYRDRVARLFGFNYRVELLVPAEKRK